MGKANKGSLKAPLNFWVSSWMISQRNWTIGMIAWWSTMAERSIMAGFTNLFWRLNRFACSERPPAYLLNHFCLHARRATKSFLYWIGFEGVSLNHFLYRRLHYIVFAQGLHWIVLCSALLNRLRAPCSSNCFVRASLNHFCVLFIESLLLTCCTESSAGLSQSPGAAIESLHALPTAESPACSSSLNRPRSVLH